MQRHRREASRLNLAGRYGSNVVHIGWCHTAYKNDRQQVHKSRSSNVTVPGVERHRPGHSLVLWGPAANGPDL